METKHLVPFDFSDSSEIPHAFTARNYYAKVIRKYSSYEDFRQDMATKVQPMGPQQTPLPNKTADISFQSASASFRSSTSVQPTVPSVPLSTQQDDADTDSDQESIAKSMPNSTNDIDMTTADSRRTSVSNHDITEADKQPLHPSVQAIAAQALSNLQTPSRSTGFTAINYRSAQAHTENNHAKSKNLLGTPKLATSEKSPVVVVRKPSPAASLQHILGPDGVSDHLEAPAQPNNALGTPILSPKPLSPIVNSGPMASQSAANSWEIGNSSQHSGPTLVPDKVPTGPGVQGIGRLGSTGDSLIRSTRFDDGDDSMRLSNHGQDTAAERDSPPNRVRRGDNPGDPIHISSPPLQTEEVVMGLTLRSDCAFFDKGESIISNV